MPRYTPFHDQLAPLNETQIWKNWAGYLVVPNYQYCITNEYYSIRNSVSLFDTSPLFKYRFSGQDVGKLFEFALARDIRSCETGQAQYTVFCDAAGFVVQDGVVLHTAENEFYLTTAEPAYRYFHQIARRQNLTQLAIDDVSEQFGILAIQGPHSHHVLNQLCDGTTELNYFDVTKTTIAEKNVFLSRTGFTGDLGYEVWCTANDAAEVFHAIFNAGKNFNVTPIGSTALKMARVEAGLLLMDVDFNSARYAWVDQQRETPIELGFRWMFRNLENDDRQFLGREQIEIEISNRSSRWKTVGLAIDVADYEQRFVDAGIPPSKYENYCESTRSVYRVGEPDWIYAGHANSFLYSSLLKRPIAIAKLPLDLAKIGTTVHLEIQVIHKPTTVKATVQPLPFFNPPRKTSNVLEVEHV